MRPRSQRKMTKRAQLKTRTANSLAEGALLGQDL